MPTRSPLRRPHRTNALPLSFELLERRRLLTVTYTVTDLGTLGGPTARPADINDAGQIVGSSLDAAGRTHAFLWQHGILTDLGTLGGPSSQAASINNLGQIIGTATPDAAAAAVPVRWDNGVIANLGLAAGTTLLHINDAGQIVGNNPDGLGFLWQNGVTTDLGAITPSGGGGFGVPANGGFAAADISNAGQIIGYAATSLTTALGLAEVHTFRWQDGVTTDLGTAPFTMGSYAAAINNTGQVAGQSTVYVNTGYGAAVIGKSFLYDGQTFAQLAVPSLQNYATDINDAGQVVGWMTGGPYLYDHGTVITLNSLIPPGTTLGGVTAINNAGQIVGYTTGVDSHAVLLTPDVAPQGPEVQLWLGGTEITNTTGSVDLGTTRLAQPLTRTFTIRNVGSETLNLTGPVTLPAGFTLASPPSATSLAPGGTATFSVRLDATPGGTASGQVSFATNDADESTFTFAISGITQPIRIIDDGATGFTTTGFALLTGQGHENDVRRALSGTGASTATWTFANLEPGTYRISTTWSTASNRATNAPYTLTNGTTPLATIPVNQRRAPAGFDDLDTTWQDLGKFTVDAGTLTVRLSNQADGWTIADAVRIERVGPPNQVEVAEPPLSPVRPGSGNPKPPPPTARLIEGLPRTIGTKPILRKPIPRRSLFGTNKLDVLRA